MESAERSPFQPGYWYYPHRTKSDYDEAFAEARDWALCDEGQLERNSVAARIFHVKEEALRKACSRFKKRKRNARGRYNTHGGNNAILTDAQEEAIRQYCYEQWEAGLGATHAMVYAAIVWLKEVSERRDYYTKRLLICLFLQAEDPDRKPPSRSWFNGWLHDNKFLHTIKTKPIAHVRLESHTEESVKKWFQELHDTCKKYKIKSSKRVLNMDEVGSRIGCPTGEHIIVPINVRDHYTSSPENRKSVTIIETIYADGRKPLPPFIITPGKKVMDNWVTQEELVGDEYVTCSPTGYTNNDIALDYLNHLILHTKAGPNQPWFLLLLDGHESHQSLKFKAKAAENHVKLFWFPSHLTHALQPLDVGVFRPWKHWHMIAVQRAIRTLDFDYSITSFMRDMAWIRDKTMQPHTIINAFKNSGMWPISAKAGIKKMRAYGKRQVSEEEKQAEDALELPQHAPPPASELWQISSSIREFAERDPTQFSSPSAKRFKSTMTNTDIALQKAHLLRVEHTALQQKLRVESKRKNTSRRSIQAGGAGEAIAVLRARIKARDEAEATESLRRAKKQLQAAINKAKKALTAAGVRARRDEKARLAVLQELKLQEIEPTEAQSTPIRQPDKQPTALEAMQCTPDFYPELVLAIQQLEQSDSSIGQEIGVANSLTAM